MIPGSRLAIISARVLHPETFALMVSPAIADLQFEGGGGRARLIRSYIGVWRAVCGALWHDMTCNVRALCADDARRLALQSNVMTFAWLMLFQVCYYFGALTLAFARWSDLRAWVDTVLLRTSVLEAVMLVSFALLVPALPVLACFWPARHVHSD